MCPCLCRLSCLHLGSPHHLPACFVAFRSHPLHSHETLIVILSFVMRPLARSLIRPYVCPSCRSGRLPARRQFASDAQVTPEIYDVVCVGGGPAGLGLLAALRESNYE